jgi:hypothetical protein
VVPKVTRSNHIGRTNSVQNWAAQNPPFLRLRQPQARAAVRFSTDVLEAFGLQQPMHVFGHDTVELFHGNGPAPAASLALPSLGRAGVISVSPALPGPQRHRAAAGSAEANAGKEGGTADNAGRTQCRAARLEDRLHRLELGHVDDRRQPTSAEQQLPGSQEKRQRPDHVDVEPCAAQDFEPDPLVDGDRNGHGDGQHRQRVNPYTQQRGEERAD